MEQVLLYWGLIEASVMLPGANNIVGLWSAIWTLGNLGLFRTF